MLIILGNWVTASGSPYSNMKEFRLCFSFFDTWRILNTVYFATTMSIEERTVEKLFLLNWVELKACQCLLDFKTLFSPLDYTDNSFFFPFCFWTWSHCVQDFIDISHKYIMYFEHTPKTPSLSSNFLSALNLFPSSP